MGNFGLAPIRDSLEKTLSYIISYASFLGKECYNIYYIKIRITLLKLDKQHKLDTYGKF